MIDFYIDRIKSAIAVGDSRISAIGRLVCQSPSLFGVASIVEQED